MIGSLGLVPCTTGSNIRLTVNQVTPAKGLPVQGVRLQGNAGNAAVIHVGFVDMDPTSGVGVLAVVPVPAAGVNPQIEISVTNAPTGFDLSQIYVRGATNDEVIGHYFAV